MIIHKLVKKGNDNLIFLGLPAASILAFILLSSNALAEVNEGVISGKNILKELSKNQVKDIDTKSYQKELDRDMAKWTNDLEKRLNEDVKKQKPIEEFKIEVSQESKKIANEIVEKSQGIVKEALGIPGDKSLATQKSLNTDFLIFASFSMGEKNLENLIKAASIYDGVVILRGFKNGDIKETAQFLSKFGEEKEGILIDPSLFKEYQIVKVPTYVLVKTCEVGTDNCKEVFDKLTGNVSPQYALEKFGTSGELVAEAKERLRK